MNIGEISKPTVDRAQIKKKLEVKSSEPIEPSKEVTDLVELSEESKHKYEQESDGEKSYLSSSSKDEEKEKLQKRPPAIDIKV